MGRVCYNSWGWRQRWWRFQRGYDGAIPVISQPFDDRWLYLAGSSYTGTAGSSITSTEVRFLDTTSTISLTLTLNTGSLFVAASSLSITALELVVCPPGLSCSFRGGDGAISATPIPAALPLFAGGVGALGLVGSRRKRKQAA